MECTACGAPGRLEALLGRLCVRCRGESKEAVWPIDVRVRVERLRTAARTRTAELVSAEQDSQMSVLLF